MSVVLHLDELEGLVLAAVLRLEPDAYAVSIRDELEATDRHVLSHGALYVTLERLIDKGCLDTRMGTPTPERGGRAKRHVHITDVGRRALAASAPSRRDDGTVHWSLLEDARHVHLPRRRVMTHRLLVALLIAMLVPAGFLAAPSGSQPQAVLTVDNMLPVHLGEYLDAATIIGSEVPAEVPQPVEWRFDQLQPGWSVGTLPPRPPSFRLNTVSQTDDALRITFEPSEVKAGATTNVWSASVEVPAWDHRDWAYLEIQARSSGSGSIRGEMHSTVASHADADYEGRSLRTERGGLVSDGTVQTYRLPFVQQPWEGPIERLTVAVWTVAGVPLEVDILSITVVPIEAVYAEERAGLRRGELDSLYRRSLFVHTPAQLSYRVEVPHEGRLDTGLGILGSEPTTFRVTVTAGDEPPETLLDVRHGDRETWPQHSLDLSAYAGQVVTLSLEADAAREGSVAFWGAPTITEGVVRATRPMPQTAIDDSAALRVLFLGNSAVAGPRGGGLLQPFEGFCRAEGLACEAVSQLNRGASQNERLVEFAHGIEFAELGPFPGVAAGAKDERVRALIASGGFDYVVVARPRPWDFVPAWVEHGPRVGVGRETIEGFQEMHRLIVEAGATTVLTVPGWWATARHQIQIVAEGQRRLKAELDAMVIGGTRHPVLLVPWGLFRADATARFGVEAVYVSDGAHGTGLSNYAQGALFYTYLTGRDPRQNPFAELPLSYLVPDDTPPELVPDEQAEWVKNHAWWYYRHYR